MKISSQAQKWTALVLIVGGLALASLATVLGAGETRPFVEAGSTREARFGWLEGSSPQPAASPFANNLVVQMCLDAVGGYYGLVQPTERRTRVIGSCRSFLSAVLEQTPANAYAAYAAAKLAAEDAAFEDMNEYLQLSYRAAPYIQWLAEPRVQLREAYREQLTERARNDQHADIRLLLQSNRGVRSIARDYIERPDFRERVLEIAETLPQAEQRRFLDNVRRIARQEGYL